MPLWTWTWAQSMTKGQENDKISPQIYFEQMKNVLFVIVDRIPVNPKEKRKQILITLITMALLFQNTMEDTLHPSVKREGGSIFPISFKHQNFCHSLPGCCDFTHIQSCNCSTHEEKTVYSARSGKYFHCNIINTLLLILTWHLLGNRHKEELIDLRLDNLKHLYLYDFKESGYFIWICVKSRKISYTIGYPVPKFKTHCANRQVTKDKTEPKSTGRGTN